MAAKGFFGVILLALSAVVGAQPANATLDFTFSFTNALNGGGFVTGVVRGLNEGTGAATSVEVLSNDLGFGVAEYAPTASNNTWTVTGGVLTDYDFLSFGISNPNTNASFFMNSSSFLGVSFRAGLSTFDQLVVTGNDGVSAADIGLIIAPSANPSVDVPVPATLPLLAAGIAGIAVLRQRKA